MLRQEEDQNEDLSGTGVYVMVGHSETHFVF